MKIRHRRELGPCDALAPGAVMSEAPLSHGSPPSFLNNLMLHQARLLSKSTTQEMARSLRSELNLETSSLCL